MAVRLFVGNLPYDATEAELREHFSAVAPLSYVYLPTDRETGKPRGFAFIEYADSAKAEEAIKRFNNQLFKGRPIAVNEARAKDDRPRTSPPPRSFEPRPSWGDQGPSDPQPPGARPARNFGPDAAPRRKGKQASRGSKAERGPKGPIRERVGGPLSWVGGEEEPDDAADDNFASRVSEDDDDGGDDNFASRVSEDEGGE
jgi:RNA recognition motif-containing protein